MHRTRKQGSYRRPQRPASWLPVSADQCHKANFTLIYIERFLFEGYLFFLEGPLRGKLELSNCYNGAGNEHDGNKGYFIKKFSNITISPYIITVFDKYKWYYLNYLKDFLVFYKQN